MNKRLPNFIIVGFPKCGSTSLHYYLNDHPEIFMPTQKELHYFTNEKLSQLNEGPQDNKVNQFNISSFSEYQKKFKNVKNERVIGEVSPSYINYPECIDKIKEKLGDEVKIIIIVRDPIKRAFSNYLHLVRESREKQSFYEALKQEDQRKKLKYSDFWYYSFNSMYYDKIKAFNNEFKDVLIVKTEDLNKKATDVLKSVYEFLEVDSNYLPGNLEKRYNPGGVFEENLITRFFFKQSSLRSFIKKVVPITPWMKHIKQKMISKYKKPTPSIDKDSEDYLVDLLKEQVIKLNQEFQINIDDWNPKFQKN
ncbi:sulfotransferase family protein [Winogradskyella vincentii]|uniref:Sulfotransferase n=1 Tax=Winogradskyella vincentii TaxID=2877122 RepID=A0ABS7Y124_9FLAO|nr:sulfotransferase [Winogradskyella vincentii]MCA0152372.1 sulfotransferase [Winogradskyella vincentii]